MKYTLLPFLPLFTSLPSPAATGHTWDGGGAFSQMTVAANWNPDAVPAAGDWFSFPDGLPAPDRVVTNNFPANTLFTAMGFHGSGYTFGGTIFQLTGVLQATAPGVTTFNAGVSFPGYGLISSQNGADFQFGPGSQIYGTPDALSFVADANSSITINGVLSAPGPTGFYGAGDIRILGAKLLTGEVLVSCNVELDNGGGLGAAGAGRVTIEDSTLLLKSGSAQLMPRNLSLGGSFSTFSTQGAAHTCSGNLEIRSSGSRIIEVLSSSLSLPGTIHSWSLNPGTVIKRGPGVLRIEGVEGNSYAGAFRIDEGEVRLDKPGWSERALTGSAVHVGNGIGLPSSARLVVENDAQLNEEAELFVNSDGLLDMTNHVERVSRLTMQPGARILTGVMPFGITGDLVVAATAGTAAAELYGSVVLSSTDRHWTVMDSPAAVDFRCHASLVRDAAIPAYHASLLLDGSGTVDLAGDHTLDVITYAGTGTLRGTGGLAFDTDLILQSGKVSGSWHLHDFHASGGVVDLHDPAAQRLLSCDRCTMNAGTEYRVTLETENADYITAIDPVTLNNPQLNVTLPPAAPAPGTEFTLISNVSGEPVNGQFAGKPWGTILGGHYLLSREGGLSANVSLTYIIPPTGITRVWDGGGVDALWTTAENWNGDIAPQPGDALLFPIVAQRKTNLNNFPAGTSFQSITVGSGDYNIGGQMVYLNGDLSFQHSSLVPQWSVPVEFTLPASVTSSAGAVAIHSPVSAGNNPITLRKGAGTGDLSLTGGLFGNSCIISTEGSVRLTGTSDYSGSTRVLSGRLRLANGEAISSHLLVAEGAELSLSGGGNVTVDEFLFVRGTLSCSGGTTCTLTAPVYCMEPTTVIRADGAITCTSAVLGNGALHKTGVAPLVFSSADLPPGTVWDIDLGIHVDEGDLVLAMSEPDSITSSPLSIGSAGLPARVVLSAANQLGENVAVQVHPSGAFDAGSFSDALGSLTMTGGLVTSQGNAVITLTTGQIITHAAQAPAVISARIAAPAGVTGQFITADGPASPDLSIQNHLNGSLFEKLGAGRIDFTVSQPPSTLEKLDLQAGSAFFFSNCQFMAIALNGGTLGGQGTVGEIVSGSGGIISPGASPGALGGYKAAWNSDTTLRMELNGLSPGAEYDQYFANSLTNLGNARLELSADFDPAPGDSFMIIRNVSGQPVSGIFAGIPQSGYVSAPGAKVFQINYTGGDGDDVMLTRIETTPPEIVSFSMNPGANPADQSNAAFVFQVTPGLLYWLQSSSDLKNWTNILSGVADLLTGQLEMQISETGGGPRKFYRLILP